MLELVKVFLEQLVQGLKITINGLEAFHMWKTVNSSLTLKKAISGLINRLLDTF
jgi:hypothetical protein